jgi:hypothetical protein
MGAKMATYGNLKAEMARRGISQGQIADFLGMSLNNVNYKINGRVSFTLREVTGIKDQFFPDETIDYLFADCEAADAILGRVDSATTQDGATK